MLLQLLPAIGWTIIMAIAIFYISNNNKFHVVYFDSNVRVEPSPSLVWTVTNNVWRVLGYVFFLLMWVMTIFVLSGLHLKYMTEKSKLDVFLIGIPLLVSVICFFAGYSSRLANNYVSVARSVFESWITQGFIKEQTADHFVDKVEDGKLLNQFAGKSWIK